jgi:hypothetical protein
MSLNKNRMTKISRFFVLLGFSLVVNSLQAGIDGQSITQTKEEEKVPLDIVETENSYTFESDLNHGGSFGKQDEFQNDFEYGHRFLISGNYYAHAGIAYDRFDFGNTRAPVPTHLQSLAGVIGIDYMHGEDVGAFIQFRPGIYTEEHIGLASFDCPITLARFFVLQPEKLYVLAGVNYAFLRGGYGAIPLTGIVWIPAEKWKVMAIPPEPRVVYSPNDNLDLWVGGEFEGGAFRTDHHDEFLNIKHVAKLSGTQVDYVDYRAGAGFTYNLTKAIALDASAGYAIERAFHFHRAGENFRTDPAPYLKIELKGKF